MRDLHLDDPTPPRAALPDEAAASTAANPAAPAVAAERAERGSASAPTGPAASAPGAAPAPAGRRADRGPTRVAVVGAGFIADFHLAVLAGLPDVRVVALCDPALARARALAERYGVLHAVGSAAELALLGVELAHVLVPPDLHGRVARELLEAGIGVFVEKPLAPSRAEATELVALARERGLPLGVNHNSLFHPAFARLLARVRAGEIGRVEHVQATLSVPLMQLDAQQYAHWMFRAPRNIVFEQAVHPLCQVHALVGAVRSASTRLLGTRELLPGQRFHDRWLVAAEGARGTAELYLAFGQGFTRNTLQVIGTDGCLEADLFHDGLTGERKTVWLDFWNSFLAQWRRGRDRRRDARRVLLGWMRYTLGLGPRRDAFFVGMRDSIERFYAALRADAAPPADAPLRADAAPPADGASALEVLDWCEAVAAGVSGEESAPLELAEPGPARPGEVCVLGGTGFIGRRVVARLAERGRPVTVVVRRARDLPPEVSGAGVTRTEPDAGAAAGERAPVRLVRGSLEDPEAVRAALRGARVVLHLATGGGDTWEEVLRSMVQGSLAVLDAAADEGVERFVYVSSIAALYTGPDAPSELEDSAPLDPRPAARAVYARGKIAVETALAARARERGIALVVARPGVVVGAGTPFQHSGLGLWARDNHCVGWGRGASPLPLVWVDDVADALVRIAEHAGRELDGRALNLCARPPLTAAGMVAELRRATGRDLHFHPRALVFSQLLELGKYAVKLAGRRPGVEPPSWRDLKARALAPAFTARTAREVLGWQPVEEREAFLDRTVRVFAPPAERSGEAPTGPDREAGRGTAPECAPGG